MGGGRALLARKVISLATKDWAFPALFFLPATAQDKLDFLHLPIIDGSVTSDVALSRLADDCCTRILRGERLYVHWWV